VDGSCARHGRSGRSFPAWSCSTPHAKPPRLSGTQAGEVGRQSCSLSMRRPEFRSSRRSRRKSGSTLPNRFYAFYVHLRWPLTGRCGGVASHRSRHVGSRLLRNRYRRCGRRREEQARPEALDSAASKVRECRWAVATSSARAHPLGAFAPWTSSSTDNLQLVGGVIESLTSAPRGTSVIVGVDDVHTSPPRRCARRSRATPKPMTCA
jgi:hypothetical protein